jgi:hypothetical protein
MEVHHFSSAGRAQASISWIDRDAIADEFLREDGIWHALERVDLAGQRGEQA